VARYVLTDSAKEDLREIILYIAQRSPEAAERVHTKLHAAMKKLADVPGMGHSRADLTAEPIRFWGVYSYLIAYDPNSTPLQIIRIVHGARAT
jgi:antitoxin ParD1/3/4/toxin ParE1/3/4